MISKWEKILTYISVGMLVLIGIAMLNKETDTINDEDIAEGSTITFDQETKKLIEDVKKIENILIEYFEKDGSINDNNKVNQASMAFLRKNRYGYNVQGVTKYIWSAHAGSLRREAKLRSYNDSEVFDEIEPIVDDLGEFSEPGTMHDIDFIHMITVVDLKLTQYSDVDYEDEYYDCLFSWAGDLETFMIDAAKFSKENYYTDQSKLYHYSYGTIGSSTSSFSGEDLRADIDGYLIADIMKKEDLLLSEAIEKYYLGALYKTRFSEFLDLFGGVEDFNDKVNMISFGELDEDYSASFGIVEFKKDLINMRDLMGMYSNPEGLNISPALRRIVVKAFTEKLQVEAQLEKSRK